MKKTKQAGTGEFIVLATAITSLMALSIDTLLPAMLTIGREFSLANDNYIQLLVTTILVSTAAGGLIAGPLADKWGRRPVAFAGGALFIFGCILAIYAANIDMLLAARLLQGLGIAGSRVAMHAIMRDRFAGDDLARILSYSAAIFLLIPLFAPSLGHWLMIQTGTWRSIFFAQAFIATTALTWVALRQPETMSKPPPDINKTCLLQTYIRIWAIPSARRHMLAACLALTPLMVFLLLAPQLLQDKYQFGDNFPIVFAALSIPVGIFSLVNGLLVKRVGARYLLRLSLSVSTTCSIIFLPVIWWSNGHPPTFLMLGYLLITQASFGLITSNITSLAMEQLGQFAGAGSALYGALATGTSALLATFIASYYSNSPEPLVLGSGFCCLACLLITSPHKSANTAKDQL